MANGSGSSDFNGYQLEISGSERFKAPLFDGLRGVGFEFLGERNYLLNEFFEILTDGLGNRLTHV